MDNDNKNIEAKNRFITGIVGMIPAGLVAGPVGIVASLLFGAIGANISEKKRNQTKYNNMKYVPSEKRYYYQKCEEKEIDNAKINGDKYALMTDEECLDYLKKIREEYPMELEGSSFEIDSKYKGCTVGNYGNKEVKIIIGYDENNKPIYKKCNYEVKGKYNQKVVEILDKAKNSGLSIKWIKVNSQTYYHERNVVLYYYKVIDDRFEYKCWLAPFDFENN